MASSIFFLVASSFTAAQAFRARPSNNGVLAINRSGSESQEALSGAASSESLVCKAFNEALLVETSPPLPVAMPGGDEVMMQKRVEISCSKESKGFWPAKVTTKYTLTGTSYMSSPFEFRGQQVLQSNSPKTDKALIFEIVFDKSDFTKAIRRNTDGRIRGFSTTSGTSGDLVFALCPYWLSSAAPRVMYMSSMSNQELAEKDVFVSFDLTEKDREPYLEGNCGLAENAPTGAK